MAEPSNPVFAPPAAAANPYATPRAAVTHDDGGADDADLASRYQRLRAAIIDYMIFVVPVAVGLIPMAMSAGRAGGKSPGAVAIIGVVAASLAFIGILVWNGLLLARRGQTLGKKAAGIRVVRSDGADAGFVRLFFLRGGLSWLIATIPWIGGLYALADMLFIFRADRRCIHDLIADTKVVEADR
jgi:uncharacterized RDD family membrane protein YckC